MWFMVCLMYDDRSDKLHNENLENLIVVKRSGQRVEFNASKVAIAIKKAFDAVLEENENKAFKTFEKVLKHINDNYKDRKTINVEDIQDIIETTLYNQKHYKVYEGFREYRNKRALSRKAFSEKQQHKFLKAIEKIEKDNFENANNANPYELIYKFGKIIYNEYTKVYILDNKFIKASEEGNIIIHNANYFSLGIFPNVHLKFKNKYLELDEMISNLINVQKDVNDEISIDNIDNILENMLITEYKKAFKLNLKKMFKLLGFLEFINFKKIQEIIDKEKDINFNIEKYAAFTFNDTIKNIFLKSYNYSKEDTLKLINKYLIRIFNTLENNVERDAKYTISFGMNKSILGKNINSQIIEQLSVKEYTKINFVVKINPNSEIINSLANVLKRNKKIYIHRVSDNNYEYFTSGICIFENINGDITSIGRNVISHTSINLTRLALKNKNKSLDEFYKELDSICELVKNQLVSSFEIIGNKTKTNYKVLFKGNILDDEKLEEGQKIRKVIKNGVLAIGVIGLKECVQILENNSKQQLQLLNQILDYLNEKCQQYSKSTKLNFGLFETPNSSARSNLLKIDKAIYGNIDNITDKKSYELIDYDFIANYKELSKIIKKFKLGKLLIFKVNQNASNKKILDIVEILQKNNIEFAKVVVGKDEH